MLSCNMIQYAIPEVSLRKPKFHSFRCLTLFYIQIINDYSTDSEAKDLADNYDIYVLLVANPDGYVYSFNGVSM